MNRIWRLSEAGPDNLGLACTDDGLVLGRTSLIERRAGRFVVRERAEIIRLLQRAYGLSHEPLAARLMPGLATVAAALNADDRCLACIAAVHLRIPDLPDRSARSALEAEDALLGSDNSRIEIQKASPDDPEHPGWPKGTPDGKGGQFRPKTEGEIAPESKARLARRIARRALRMAALALLRMIPETAAAAVPVVDIAADAALALDIARAVTDFIKLAVDAAAAFSFVQKGPHTLADIQVTTGNYQEFANYDAFLKMQLWFEHFAKQFGSAGAGRQYHHIVTQGGLNSVNIPAERLQNTDNIITLPTLLHEAVNAEYMKPAPDGSAMNVYRWLQTQPYDVQREYGLRILRGLNILK